MDLAIVSAIFIFIAIVLAIALMRWKSPEKAGWQLLQTQVLELNKRLTEMQSGLAENQAQNLTTLAQHLNQATATLNQQLNNVTQTLNNQLAKTQSNIGQQLEGQAKVVTEVHSKLGELAKTAEHIREVGKDLSSLQNLLRAPKFRGNIGELFLEDLLAQLIPGRYKMQYLFPSDNKRVDAAIILEAGIVPVDSKFPLDAFNRFLNAENEAEKKVARREFAQAFKAKVKEITNYIRPNEGTLDFAMMYIPAENIFYEVIIKDDNFGEEKGLWSIALENKVVPTSPNSFLAYLMAIAYGLRGMKIEERAQEIIKKLGQLQQSFNKFYEHFDKLGKNIGQASKNYEEAQKRVEKFGNRLSHLTGIDSEVELEAEATPVISSQTEIRQLKEG